MVMLTERGVVFVVIMAGAPIEVLNAACEEWEGRAHMAIGFKDKYTKVKNSIMCILPAHQQKTSMISRLQ